MADTQERKKPPILKTAILLVVILLVEAVVIVGGMLLVAGPAEVRASDALGSVEALEEEKVLEALVLEDRLANNKTGVTFLYDTEIYVQVKRKHFERVEEELEQFRHEIRAELAAIWRTSEPHHFQEPRLETLTRKVQALLSGRFGDDPATGEPIILKSVVVMGTGFRVDQ